MSEDRQQGHPDMPRRIVEAGAKLLEMSARSDPTMVAELLHDLPPEAQQLLIVEWIKRELAFVAPAQRREFVDRVGDAFPGHSNWFAQIQLRSDGSLEEATVTIPGPQTAPNPAIQGGPDSQDPNAVPIDDVTVDSHRKAGDSTLARPAGENRSTHLHRSGIPLRMGDYDLLEELGRGGMGIVFQARQRTANRIVALKVIRADRLLELAENDRADAIARFRAEAQAAAGLEHDNLVTVYEVGESEGRHFYSMRYVEGTSLAEETRKGPLSNVRCANYIKSIASAVEAAHRQSVLHRDLKPHNVMIDQATDRALVADFGLAKLLDVERSATQTGALLGSPPYMAPEQTKDSSKVDQAADIYGIGATMYHVLTGRPPFQTSSLAETIRQVNEEEPIAPRRLNPDVDPDLETICLKCLEKEPGRRYASSLEIVKELDRYLQGKPIAARPVGKIGRLRRWSRRNPMTAALTSIALLLAIALVIAASVGYASTTSALAEEKRQRKRADEESQSAQKNLARAVDAVNQSFITIAESRRLKAEGLISLRLSLLQSATPFLEAFVNESHDDRELVQLQTRALRNLAEAYKELGRMDEAENALTAADEKIERLIRQDASTELQVEAAMIAREQGLLYNLQSRASESEVAFQKAVDTYRKGRASEPESTAMTLGLALSLSDLGTHLAQRTGELLEAQALYEESLAIRHELANKMPNDSANLINTVQLHHSIGNIALERRQFDQAEQAYQQGVEILKTYRGQLVSDPTFLPTYAVLQHGLGVINVHRRDFDAAHSYLVEAVGIREQLVAIQPNAPMRKYELASERAAFAAVLSAIGNKSGAGEQLDRALEGLSEALATEEIADWRSMHAGVLDQRASVHVEQRQMAAALEKYEQAIEERKALVDQYPNQVTYRSDLADGHYNLGIFHSERNERVDSERHYLAAEASYRKAIEMAPNFAEYRVSLSDCLNNLALLYEAWGQIDKAQEKFLECIPVLQQLATSDSQARYHQGRIQLSLGELFAKEQQQAAAIDYLTESIATLEAFLSDFEDDEDAKILLAAGYVARAKLYGPLGKIEEGKSDFGRALQIVPLLVKPELFLQRANWLLEFDKQD